MQKKWVIGITAMSLVATTAIGSTLAYFTTQTQQMTNTFTVAAPNGVTAQLREPKWDGYGFNQKMSTGIMQWSDPDGKHAINPYDQSLGINKANVMLPGDFIDKNPTMKNTTNCSWDWFGNCIAPDASHNVPVYMAMKVTYPKGFNHDNEYITNSDKKIRNETRLETEAEEKYGFVNDGWVRLDYLVANEDSQIYLWCGKSADSDYPVPVAVNSSEAPASLFSFVRINSNDRQPSKDAIQNKVLSNFNIKLQGAVIQSRNLDLFTNNTMKNNITENNTTLKTIESELAGQLGATTK